VAIVLAWETVQKLRGARRGRPVSAGGLTKRATAAGQNPEHDYRYYVLAEPSISDEAYDANPGAPGSGRYPGWSSRFPHAAGGRRATKTFPSVRHGVGDAEPGEHLLERVGV
jgi:hypothetical protein